MGTSARHPAGAAHTHSSQSFRRGQGLVRKETQVHQLKSMKALFKVAQNLHQELKAPMKWHGNAGQAHHKDVTEPMTLSAEAAKREKGAVGGTQWEGKSNITGAPAPGVSSARGP